MRSFLLSLALWSLLAPNAAIHAGERNVHNHDHKGHSIRCPACNYVCQLSVIKSKETKHCFDVQYKPICIPKVTFPWEKGHGKGKGCNDQCVSNGCAKVKVVRVLVKHEYECSRCKYVWTPVPIKGKDGGKYEAAPPQPGANVPPAPARIEASRNRHPRQMSAAAEGGARTEPELPEEDGERTYFEILTGWFK